SALNVLCHSLGIAADIDICAFGEPGPHLAADLAHTILHVEFLLTVARPRQRQAREQARRLHRIELVRIEEIAIAALMPEEQPVLAGCTRRLAVEQEGSKRRDARAGPDHDDRRPGILRQAEAVRLLHIDLELLAFTDSFAKERG